MSSVRHTQRDVKRWQDGDMRKRSTAAGMLVAEQQLRRVIGYRDLATLVIAIDPRPSRRPNRSAPSGGRRTRYRLTVNPRGSPSKFYDDPDILDLRGTDLTDAILGTANLTRASVRGAKGLPTRSPYGADRGICDRVD